MIDQRQKIECIYDEMQNYVQAIDGDVQGISISPWVIEGIVVNLQNGRIIHYNNITKSFKYFESYSDAAIFYESFPITEEEFRRHFSRRMYERLILSGISQEGLSYGTRISEGTISQYINGNVNPTGYNIAKICKVLECTPNDLMGFNLKENE